MIPSANLSIEHTGGGRLDQSQVLPQWRLAAAADAYRYA